MAAEKRSSSPRTDISTLTCNKHNIDLQMQENDAGANNIKKNRLNSIPSELTSYIVDQEYSQYSADSLQAWQLMLSQKESLFQHYNRCIDQEYLLGFYKIGFSSKKIPSIFEINETLNSIGWSAVCVDGYLPSRIYAKFIENKIFPIARYIRRLEQINHSPIPDFIHDVTGHLPMLFSHGYQSFLQRMIKLMSQHQGSDLDKALFLANVELGNLKIMLNPPIKKLQAVENKIQRILIELKNKPSILTQLNRMFLWSIEFGVLGNTEEYKCFGAGILSSPLELQECCKRRKKIVPYSMMVIDQEINFSSLQDQFFVIQHINDLDDVLDQYVINQQNLNS